MKGSPDGFESVTSTYKNIRDDEIRQPHESGKYSPSGKYASLHY